MIDTPDEGTSAQISILDVNGEPRIYCCESLKANDLAENSHVLCAGIDLNPALDSQGHNAVDLAQALKEACVREGGMAAIPPAVKASLSSVAKILNIAWIERGLENPARVICARGTVCPREPTCYGQSSSMQQLTSVQDIQRKIVSQLT